MIEGGANVLGTSTGFGKYHFYDCGAYGLFTLASERFQPSFVGKKTTQYGDFFNRPKKRIDVTKAQVWKDVGAALKTFGEPVTVLDVGAYIGTFCIPLALCAKAEGVELKIHSFEPGPTQDLVAINVDANRLSDTVTVHRNAIAGFDGYTIYTFSDGGSVGGNIFAPASDGSLERVVPVSTIDTFCRDIEGPLLIKLDTQGHEPHIMRNAMRTINEKRAIWHIEFMKWSGETKIGGEHFYEFLLREFHIFSDDELITSERMPGFLTEIDARPHRMADLLLVPQGTPLADRLVQISRPKQSILGRLFG